MKRLWFPLFQVVIIAVSGVVGGILALRLADAPVVAPLSVDILGGKYEQQSAAVGDAWETIGTVRRSVANPNTIRLFLNPGILPTPTGYSSVTPVSSPVPSATSTLIPTNTPRPTATASRTPTRTSTATVTATATNTPGDDDFETPTPEDDIPTDEPTPEPAEKTCELKVVVSGGIRVRREPTRSAVQIGYAIYPTQPTIDEFEVVAYADPVLKRTYNELWAHAKVSDTVTGWFVVLTKMGLSDIQPEWWTAGVTGNTEICPGVEGWPQGLEPPEVIVSVPDGGPFASGKILPGVHISWPTNFDAAALAPYIGIAKCLPLTENICRVLKQNNPAIVTIWRDYRIENPTDHELRFDHAGYASRVYALAQLDFDMIEIMNELGFSDAQYPYLSDFMIDVAAYFGDRGECILAPAFYPGWPDIGKRQWGSIVKYMQWANEHPCGKWADGTPKYHGVSWHAAMYYPGTVPEWPWVNWSYVAGNAILGDVQMREDYGFGLRDFMGPKIVSEDGLTDGYQGEGDRKPTCYDNKLAVQETIRVYTAHHSIFDGFAFWNFGSPGKWTDETACLPDMFK